MTSGPVSGSYDLYEGCGVLSMLFIPSVPTGQLFSDKSADDGVGEMEVSIRF